MKAFEVSRVEVLAASRQSLLAKGEKSTRPNGTYRDIPRKEQLRDRVLG